MTKNLKLQKIPLTQFRVSYSELFDDFYIPHPFDFSKYVVRVGDILVGFGEEQYLHNALKKIKDRYGDNISLSLIESKKIPFLSAPLVRRHGSLETPVGKWVIYKDRFTDVPVVIMAFDPNKPGHCLVAEEVGHFDETASYAEGLYFYDPVCRMKGILIKDSSLDVAPFIQQLASFFGTDIDSARFVKVSRTKYVYPFRSNRRPRVRTVSVPLHETDLLFVEKDDVLPASWEITTGSEYSNKNRNEPELWRPL